MQVSNRKVDYITRSQSCCLTVKRKRSIISIRSYAKHANDLVFSLGDLRAKRAKDLIWSLVTQSKVYFCLL